MIKTYIDFSQKPNGAWVDVPPDFRSGIEVASKLLEHAIGNLDPLVVTARWQYLRDPTHGPQVELSLEYRVEDEIELEPGDTVATSSSVSFSPTELHDLEQLKRKLDRVASSMNLRMMQSNLQGLIRQRKRLATLVHPEA
jgi:hypothetical protein